MPCEGYEFSFVNLVHTISVNGIVRIGNFVLQFEALIS